MVKGIESDSCLKYDSISENVSYTPKQGFHFLQNLLIQPTSHVAQDPSIHLMNIERLHHCLPRIFKNEKSCRWNLEDVFVYFVQQIHLEMPIHSQEDMI